MDGSVYIDASVEVASDDDLIRYEENHYDVPAVAHANITSRPEEGNLAY
jgi:hypothetical protein